MRQAEFDRCRQEAFNIARKFYDQAVSVGISPERMSIETAIESGSVGETIVDWIKRAEPRIDYAVCGSRGSGAMRRFLGGIADSLGLGLGSTSDYLVHHLNIPVIVAKRPVGDPSLDALLQHLREEHVGGASAGVAEQPPPRPHKPPPKVHAHGREEEAGIAGGSA